jgi:hypothetical protein
LGGINIGERTMISPKVTLITEGHPIEPVDRYSFITVAPIVIEARVWIGAGPRSCRESPSGTTRWSVPGRDREGRSSSDGDYWPPGTPFVDT